MLFFLGLNGGDSITDDEEKKTITLNSFYTWMIWSILLGAVGYFTYGGFDGFFAILLLVALLGIGILICVIPYIGILIYYLLYIPHITTAIATLTGIHPTLLTDLMVGIHVILGTLLCIALTFFVTHKLVSKS